MTIPLRDSSADATVAPLFAAGDCVLFQGDSITDMGRGRSENPNHLLGHGYAFLIAAQQGADYPERQLTFINRGISGNQVSDLAARWQTDTLDFKPDVLSVLIGVNDAAHYLANDLPLLPENYERIYHQLLADTIAALPAVKLVLGEPFFLPGQHTSARYDEWQATLHRLQAIVDSLAQQYHAPVVHFQQVFDNAIRHAPIEYWIWDGIHPTYSGHQLMAEEWKRAFSGFYGLPTCR